MYCQVGTLALVSVISKNKALQFASRSARHALGSAQLAGAEHPDIPSHVSSRWSGSPLEFTKQNAVGCCCSLSSRGGTPAAAAFRARADGSGRVAPLRSGAAAWSGAAQQDDDDDNDDETTTAAAAKARERVGLIMLERVCSCFLSLRFVRLSRRGDAAGGCRVSRASATTTIKSCVKPPRARGRYRVLVGESRVACRSWDRIGLQPNFIV
jgi:hypothetical protein